MNISLSIRKDPLARNLVLASVLISTCIFTSAHAQWRVIDNAANDKLNTVNDRIGNSSANGNGNGTVTGNLRELYQQQQFESYDSSNHYMQAAEEPEERLEEGRPTTVSITAESRCPQPSAQGVAQQQWEICKEIVATELAQYNYSLKMYEITKKRQEYLDELRQQRAGFGAHEIGKLQDNTNRILLLMSQMEIDKQQQKTYQDAYAARLHYLQQASRTMTQQALEGTKSDSGGLGGVIGGLVGAGALKLALDQAQSERRHRF